jgi:hypothetical protein
MNEYQVGDMVEFKKQHPCGNKIWEVTRIGVDYKFKCKKCQHTIMIERDKISKIIKKRIGYEVYPKC